MRTLHAATAVLVAGLLVGCAGLGDGFAKDTGGPVEFTHGPWRTPEEEPRARAPSAPPPPPSPVRPVGDITISLDPPEAFTGIELHQCDNLRARAFFQAGAATLRDIPLDGACKVAFKGGDAPASLAPVSGGTSWACKLRNEELTCAPDSPRR